MEREAVRIWSTFEGEEYRRVKHNTKKYGNRILKCQSIDTVTFFKRKGTERHFILAGCWDLPIGM